MKSLSRSILFLSLLVVLLCACQAEEPVPTATVAPTIATVTSTMEPTVTEMVMPSVTPEPTATESPSVLENVIPSGEYIYLYGWNEELEPKTYVLKTIENELILVADGKTQLLGNNGTSLFYHYANEGVKIVTAYTLFGLDERIATREISINCDYYSISPDNRYITTGWCGEDISPDHGFGVYDLVTNQHLRLVGWISNENDKNRDRSFAQFSPDGEWVSFLDVYTSEEYEKEYGIYLIPSTCINQSNSCVDLMRGPFWSEELDLYRHNYSYAWSFDSKYILIANKDRTDLFILNINDESFQFIDLGIGFGIESVNWSPDGKKILFIALAANEPGEEGYGTLYFYDLETHEIEEIAIEDFNIDNAQWIVVD